ncbi:MAG: hypothetical protein GY765_08200 [bacterium]|nr:hypothetical protein [bacterium]
MKRALKKLTLNKKTVAHLDGGKLRNVQGAGGCVINDQDCSDGEGGEGGNDGEYGGSGGGGGIGTFNTCASCVGVSCNIDCPVTVTGDRYKDCWGC